MVTSLGTQISEVKAGICDVQDKISQVEAYISKVQLDISKVQHDILKVENTLEELMHQLSGDGMGGKQEMLLMRQMENLENKLKALRDQDKARLQDREKALQDREKALREELRLLLQQQNMLLEQSRRTEAVPMYVDENTIPSPPVMEVIVEEVQDRIRETESNQIVKNCNKKRETVWSDSQTDILIYMYQDAWFTKSKGKVSNKHWANIAQMVNARCGTTFLGSQCKNKWDSLRKSYLKEREKERRPGTAPSSWPLFDRLHNILGKSARLEGLKNGCNGGFVNVNQNEEESNALGDDDDIGTSKHDGITMNDDMRSLEIKLISEEKLIGVEGKAIKKKKRLSCGSIGDRMERGMQRMTDALWYIEKVRMEEETKRMKMVCEVNLKIAELISLSSGKKDQTQTG